jgi:two-component system sensor kinase FixL
MPELPPVELQAVLDATADAVIIIDHTGTMQVFNRAAERLFGYGTGEALGRNVSMLMTNRDREQYGGDVEHHLRAGIPHLIGSGREVMARRKDGSIFRTLLSIGRMPDRDPPRFVGFLHDLTLRQQALVAAERERDRANHYLEAAQTILLGMDLERRVTMLNRKGCEVLGISQQQLLGTDWFGHMVPAEQRDRLALEFDALPWRRPRQPLYCEYPVPIHGGAQRLIAWRCVVMEHANGDVSGILCSGDDVTEIRRGEREVREARERMTHVSRLATMGEMASGIAHEINQPLAAITSYAQASARLLAGTSPDLSDVRDALQQIAGQALRAGEIIHRLRSLVRNRATTRESADVNEVIAQIEPLTRADARASEVRLGFELAAGLARVNVDRIQIQQVVLNLVRNAIDAVRDAPPGAREICVRTAPTQDGHVQILVEDNGPGVAAQIRAQLFTPFVTTRQNGTGLGLAVSRTIIEAHRGRLDYRPREPHGACFTVTLPPETDAPA